MPCVERTAMNGDGRAAMHGTSAIDTDYGPSRALASAFPLLLAVADDELAVAAIRVTASLARARGAVPTVIRALDGFRETTSAVYPGMGAVIDAYSGPDFRQECLEKLQRQIVSVAGRVEWKVEVADLPPMDAIIERAHAFRAGLIVMGLRHHGVLRRAISRDLLAEVVRVTRLPVLAVRSEMATLPRRVVVAMDFGPASIRAARLARHLLADAGAMCLVHAAPTNSDAVQAELERVIESLAPAPSMTMTSVFLHGDIASSIEGYAQAVEADLLAVGNNDPPRRDRNFMASTSMKLAHTARWSTLVVPRRRDD